ncbi:DUF4468 domain-containing protein [Spirosoma sp. BT702]|uniref:DUF4468 domain-containing protein n=1 Tax=Spirosoma profusum TaxID=2771354 RepID=A0A927AQU4_9BACT|nr:DUF4468 domain-containing protein [Spirosoma profusum]MBD2701218.1 DUF4468 domain-containing protein [Spirosoma profusum]
MKAIFFALLVCYSATLFAQVQLPANEAGQVQYQEIIKLQDSKRPAKKIMEHARIWADDQYGNTSNTEVHFDQEHNILFVKASYPLGKQSVRYTLTIEPKYGRYRATLTDLIADNGGMFVPIQPKSPTVSDLTKSGSTQTVAEQAVEQQTTLYEQLDQACRATLASLREALTEGEQ